MRLPASSLCALLASVALCASALSTTEVAAEQPMLAKPSALDAKYQEKLRELERLRDRIDQILKDANRANDTPAPTPEAAPAKSEVPALQLDRVNSYGGGFAWNMTIGWEFSVQSSVEVTELGVWDADQKGLSGAIPVGLWEASGKLVVSAEVPAGEDAPLVDQFRTVKIKPTQLEAGRSYVIGALYGPAVKEHVISGGANFSTAAPIHWLKSRRGKTPELAFPGGEAALSDNFPGSFGPNFWITSSDSAKATRSYYRTRLVPQPPKLQTVVVPELADGSHREEKIITISLYALPDGQLSQVMFGDKPVGTGEDAFKRIASDLKLAAEKPADVPPQYRVAAMPTVRSSDLQAAMSVVDRRVYNPRDRWSTSRNVEVSSLYAARIPQLELNGQFIVADRFRDAGDYVEDRWTGLLWQKDGIASGKKNFNEARDYAAGLELEGIKAWRVPTVDELATIFPATYAPFINTKYTPAQCCQGPTEFASYWTSELDPPTPDYAFVYQWYAKGGANNCYASKNYCYVRCVHDALEKQQPR